MKKVLSLGFILFLLQGCVNTNTETQKEPVPMSTNEKANENTEKQNNPQLEQQRVIDDFAKAIGSKDGNLFLSLTSEKIFESKPSLKGMDANAIGKAFGEYFNSENIVFKIIPELGHYQGNGTYYRARINVFLDGKDVTINEAGKNELILQKENDTWKIIDIEIELPKNRN